MLDWLSSLSIRKHQDQVNLAMLTSLATNAPDDFVKIVKGEGEDVDDEVADYSRKWWEPEQD